MTSDMKTIRKSLGSAQKPRAFPFPTGLSCFISYSTKDQLFVDRLYSDLERRGIRCWFARDDLPIGNPILKNVHDAIRSRDKFILVLSRNSIDSNWVEKEVLTAFEEEDSRGQTVLFPVRLDDEVLKTQKAWASHLRSRNIGDFRAWRNSQAYKRTFDRIIRELKPPEKSAPARKYKPLLERVKLFPRDLPVSVIFNDHVSAIKTALTRDRSVGQRIVVVYGPPGYGKSYVISAWWRDSGRLTFRNAALYLDCSQSPGDQIIRSISSYFCSKESEMLDDELAGAMRAAGKSIIILDGLSAVEPEGAYTLKTEADVVALRKVRDLLRFVKDKDLPVSMVLGIQTSRMDDRAVIASLVANHNNVTSIQMKRLSNREGLIVFKELGVDGISDDDLGELANQLMGLPIAIEAAAIVLATSGNYGDEVARERLITLTSHRENDFHIFGQFLKRIVDSLGNTPGQAEAHPYAFMRLLSLFNGRVHRSRVETILAPGRIERLSASKLDWLVSRTFGLVKLDGDYLYIHPFVRSIILAEIDSILLGNEVDQNITLAEIQWIHIVAAHTFLSKIDPDPTQISNVDIEQIEGALHHLLSLSSLGSIEASIIESDQVQMLFAKVDGRNPASIMKYCIHDIVNKYLVDDSHKVTRILGHYETKARLLNFFAPHLGKFVEHEFIDKRDAQKIYSEMGICWMHSGRLKLANDVLSVALRFSPKYKPGSRFIDVLSSDSLQDDWVQFADLSTAQALIIMREGRSKDIIDMFFQNTVDIANIVLQSVEDGFSERKLLLTIAPALRAARRVRSEERRVGKECLE